MKMEVGVDENGWERARDGLGVATIGLSNSRQGHLHNGDQAARQSRMMWSICGRRFTTTRFGRWESSMGSFDSPPLNSY